MIGLVLVAHGPLPDALLESAAMIAGEFESIATLSLMPGDSLDELIDRIRAAAEGVDSGDGVLILLDLFGGTPSNAATSVRSRTRPVRIHAAASVRDEGVDLPIVAKRTRH